MKKRLLWIDQLKGGTILLVVIGHICDGYLSAHVYIGKESEVLSFIYNIIYSFHMPLCFLISGYVYHLSYIKGGMVNRKKIFAHAADFCFVYLFTSILMFLFKSIMSGSVNNVISLKDLLLIPIMPLSGLWYFYVLVELYLIFIFIEESELINLKTVAVLFFVSCLSDFLPWIKLFQVSRLFHHAVFFALGCYLCEVYTKRTVHNNIRRIIIGVSLLTSLVIVLLAMQEKQINTIPVMSSIIGCIISSALIFVLSDSEGHFKPISLLGYHMVEIYVFHLFVVPAVRIIILKMIGTDFLLNMSAVLTLGVFVPVFIGKLMRISLTHTHTHTNLYEIYFKFISGFMQMSAHN